MFSKKALSERDTINRTVGAIARGENRLLLVMATGTGKTYTAFQIIYRLWKSKIKKRILYLADRNNLITQTKKGDFKHFKDKCHIIKQKKIDTSYEIYLALYQGLTNYDDEADAYKNFSPNFFDLIIVDECHRGSVDADKAWHKILQYFSSATQIGMTATPKETENLSNIEYFGEPIYTYSLKQGIDDGFLAPYKVLRVGMNVDSCGGFHTPALCAVIKGMKADCNHLIRTTPPMLCVRSVDLEGYRPERGKTDVNGEIIEDRLYNRKDFDRSIVIDERTDVVAKKIMEYLNNSEPMAKTIVFCVDIEHAERMRQALLRYAAPEITGKSDTYIVRITGDDPVAKGYLEDFINPEAPFPVIATTSKLMSTGTDAPALTRKERVENIRKRNYWAKYGENARRVLNALLDKYAETGIENIEEMQVLTIEPLKNLGTPAEIVKIFGGKEKYLAALKELENEIYAA
ncbi:DEAD/DEAH box helicase family protein [Treponema sp. OMZ 857]|nr:type I restriction endonuclease subunit R [Treponema sp. OMZ 857]UTC43067.1 DEAD/DEAH box helicase family protein [Treponema sp. OMZ 857]